MADRIDAINQKLDKVLKAQAALEEQLDMLHSLVVALAQGLKI